MLLLIELLLKWSCKKIKNLKSLKYIRKSKYILSILCVQYVSKIFINMRLQFGYHCISILTSFPMLDPKFGKSSIIFHTRRFLVRISRLLIGKVEAIKSRRRV